MPPIAAVKYPIIGTVTPNATFTIQNSSGTAIYTGRSVTGTVDISNILQDYLNSELVTVTDENLPDVQNGKLVQQFFLTSSAGVFTVYASNNYNDIWIDEVTDDMLISDIIGKEVHPEQIIFADALSPNNTGAINISGTNYPVNGSASIAAGVDGIYALTLANVTQYLSQSWRCVGYNGSIYVYASDFAFAYSYDGIVINQGTGGTTGIGGARDIAYGNGIFVCVRSLGYISYSVNGINWTNKVAIIGSSGSGYDINCVIFNSGQFIAMGETRYIYTSTDGINWVRRSTSVGPSIYRGIAYGNGVYVGVGNNTIVSVSENLTTWSQVNVPGSKTNKQCITFANGSFVTFAYYNDSGVSFSEDGYVWQSQDIDTPQILSVAYGNGNFIGVGYNGNYAISKNGENWDLGNTGTQRTIADILFDGAKFVGCGENGEMYIFDTVQISTTDITFNGDPITFDISDGCERYAIYFVNKWGGRTSMLVKGKVIDGVTYGTFKIRTSYDRLSPTAFETRTIRNEVTHTHTFNTGWLTDEDNAKIEDLITSPKVWIHDFEQGVIKSAYVQQTNFTTKRFDNNRVSNSTIVIYEAQDHLRR